MCPSALDHWRTTLPLAQEAARETLPAPQGLPCSFHRVCSSKDGDGEPRGVLQRQRLGALPSPIFRENTTQALHSSLFLARGVCNARERNPDRGRSLLLDARDAH